MSLQNKRLFLIFYLPVVVSFVCLQCSCAPQLHEQMEVAYDISPSSDRLVLSANGKGYTDLYLLNLKDKTVEALTSTPEFERDPKFSPDGKYVVYAATDKPKQAAHIYLLRLDTPIKKAQQVTFDTRFYDAMPSFSSDGNKIVFARAMRRRPYSMGGWTWDDWDICKIGVDGKNLLQITSQKYYQLYPPDFSNDMQNILFAADHRVAGELLTDVFEVKALKHSLPKRITTDGKSSAPRYSPKSKQIVFISDRAEAYNYDVYTLNLSTSAVRRITHNHSYNKLPMFTSGEERILFLSDKNRETRYDLYQVDADGKNMRLVADSSLFDNPLGWKPKY